MLLAGDRGRPAGGEFPRALDGHAGRLDHGEAAMKRKRTKRAWAIIGPRKKIVTYEKGVRPLLVFERKFRADSSMWEKGERVIPVTILYGGRP
jgi:hypothetical protein